MSILYSKNMSYEELCFLLIISSLFNPLLQMSIPETTTTTTNAEFVVTKCYTTDHCVWSWSPPPLPVIWIQWHDVWFSVRGCLTVIIQEVCFKLHTKIRNFRMQKASRQFAESTISSWTYFLKVKVVLITHKCCVPRHD